MDKNVTRLARLDTAIIRSVLQYDGGRVFSESRKYGRRIKFWWTKGPEGRPERIKEILKVAFGSRFISCGQYGNDFVVELKDFDYV